MSGEELDLGSIEQNLADVNGFPRGIGGVVDVLFDNQEKLIAEVKRLRGQVKTSKREMLDLLGQRLLIGPSDYDRMVVELETGISDWD